MGQFSQINLNRIAFTNKCLSNCIAQQTSLLQGLTKNSVLAKPLPKESKQRICLRRNSRKWCLFEDTRYRITDRTVNTHPFFIYKTHQLIGKKKALLFSLTKK